MKTILILFLAFSIQVAVAGESGFVLNGKRIATFKDGEKIGPSAAEYLKTRKPAEAKSNTNERFQWVVYYEEIGDHVCYMADGRSAIHKHGIGSETTGNFGGFSLSCVKR